MSSSNHSDIAVSVRGLGKSYTIVHNTERHSTLAETVLHRLKNPLARPSRETFWALKDVTFDVKRGDVLGIIGRNGAGKSTLLKVLSRITEPATGEVELHGRVGSLLEVGTGFHPELTGRENVYLNGAILGMRRSEIRKQFDAIVDFSGVERFLDTPVKRYSSGMYVRLAFAVAAHLEPDILVVDEVLAVGDAEFQQKCLGKIGAVARSGRTVLFVSHNSLALGSLCTRGIVLDQGVVRADFGIADALQVYSQLTTSTDGGVVLRRSPELSWSGFSSHPSATTVSPSNDISFGLLFTASADAPLNNVEIDCGIVNSLGHMVVHGRSDAVYGPIQVRPGSQIEARYTFQQPRLAPGSYTLTIYARTPQKELYWAEGVGAFQVVAQMDFGRGNAITALKGLTVPRYALEVTEARA